MITFDAHRRERRGSRFVPVLLGLGLLLATACVSTQLPPIGSASSFAPETDERQLWEASRQAEESLLPTSAIYAHAALEQYVQGIADELTPASYRIAGGKPIRVRVRKDPRLNASAMAHGLVILHTGTLARVETEGQLAGVLAHEIAHVTHRHQIREARAIRNRETATAVVGFMALLGMAALAVDQERRGNPGAAEAIVQAGAPMLLVGLQLTKAAMVNGYSRDLEREADEEGMRLMAAAGYSPRELGGFFRQVLAGSPDAGGLETFFYGSHPRTRERLDTVQRLAGTLPVTRPRKADQEEFDRRMVAVRFANARYDAAFGRVALARRQVRKGLAALPPAIRPGVAHIMDGHLAVSTAFGLRWKNDLSGESTFLARAERSYREAIAWGEAEPGRLAFAAQGYKALGFFLDAQGRARGCEARKALEHYLELQPAAPDRGDVETKIRGISC